MCVNTQKTSWAWYEGVCVRYPNVGKYTCKYLNTCKLMIERIYIPT